MWWCQFIDWLKFETRPSSLLNFGTAYSLYNSASTVRHSDYILQNLLHLILHLHSQSQQSVIKPRRCQTLYFTLRAEVILRLSSPYYGLNKFYVIFFPGALIL